MDFVEREVYLKSHLAVDDKSRIYRRMLSVMVCIVVESIVLSKEEKKGVTFYWILYIVSGKYLQCKEMQFAETYTRYHIQIKGMFLY